MAIAIVGIIALALAGWRRGATQPASAADPE
jgi:hypothetical protein